MYRSWNACYHYDPACVYFATFSCSLLTFIADYIIQGHRFDILEDIGCYPVVYNTLPSYFLYFMWSPIFGCISFCFSGWSSPFPFTFSFPDSKPTAMTLRSFWVRRAQFNQLITSNSSMSISRYLRLVFLALIDMMCTLPLGIYSIYIGNKGVTLAPWISWEDTHFNFSHVGLVPSLIWRLNPSYRVSMELSQWLPIACAFLFFGLFGFAAEAKKHYKLVYWAVMKRFGVKPALPKQPFSYKSYR
jgi:pheromone a factor receptor